MFAISGPIHNSNALHRGSTGQLWHGKLSNMKAHVLAQNTLQRRVSSFDPSVSTFVMRDQVSYLPLSSGDRKSLQRVLYHIDHAIQ
jgi:hypothetical protein